MHQMFQAICLPSEDKIGKLQFAQPETSSSFIVLLKFSYSAYIQI